LEYFNKANLASLVLH